MRLVLLAVTASLVLGACTDSTGPAGSSPATGVLVLNTYGSAGVTTIPIATGITTHIDFGTSFDGAIFTLLGDSLISTSSSFGGDQLYVANLDAGSLSRVQLPAGSNPAGAAFVPTGIPGAANGRIIVALRNAGALAQVSSPSTVTTIPGAGLCPSDVVFYNGSAWSVDANENCSSDYSVQGNGRLIRMSLNAADRDTISLGAHVVAPQRAFVIDQYAYVLSSGDFYSTSASLTKVNLATKQVISIIQFNDGIYGTTMTHGRDGLLYVTAAPNPVAPAPYSPALYVIDPSTMATVGPYSSTTDHTRLLTKSDGTHPRCSAATADAIGNIYCVENGQATATLLVFTAATGVLVSSAPAGTIASDVTLR